MTIEEWVNKSRAEQAERFGEIELKTDCVNCKTNSRGEAECAILIPDYYFTGKHSPLVCECRVCHFYKERGTE